MFEPGHFIDGSWRAPTSAARLQVFSPSNGEVIGAVAIAQKSEVDFAASAARRSFDSGCTLDRDKRKLWLSRLLKACSGRSRDFAEAISSEVGIPLAYCNQVQVPVALAHLELAIDLVDRYEFEWQVKGSSVIREPIGVVGMITPWNWPLVQIVCKIAPALAAGCAMILKPSEIAPTVARLFSMAVVEAGIPPGVYNCVEGDGQTTGEAVACHPDIDMVSFTGSTKAGIRVATLAAPTVKRVTQELGGKSPFIVLRDAELHSAIAAAISGCMDNNGQTCDAPTRLLVPENQHREALAFVKAEVEKYNVGLPNESTTKLGPLVSRTQFDRVQDMIASGISEGAEIVVGGLGRPNSLEAGNFVMPTVFTRVQRSMRIWREEIFGPVLSIMPYSSEDEALVLANDTEYGLAAYVHSKDADHAMRFARRLNAGTVYVNSPAYNLEVPFGGYKSSGNGREYGKYGMDEFTELKSIVL